MLTVCLVNVEEGFDGFNDKLTRCGGTLIRG